MIRNYPDALRLRPGTPMAYAVHTTSRGDLRAGVQRDANRHYFVTSLMNPKTSVNVDMLATINEQMVT